MSGAMAASVASLYVGDLGPTISDSDLFNFFSTIGPVSSTRVCRDSISGSSLGYAYVNYFYPFHASTALELLNHRVLNGSSIRIMRSLRDPYRRKAGLANLFVKNLDLSITSAKLEQIFCKFGAILSCKIAMQDGKSKGFGFVQFESEAAADSAVEAVNGTVIEGKEVYVGKFLKKNQRESVSTKTKFRNLYVNNLDLDMTEDTLRNKFSAFGKIDSLVIVKNNQGNSKGFGFISFCLPEDAEKAMEAMNGAKIGSKIMYVGWAQKKAEREEFLKQFKGRQKEHDQEFRASTVYVKNFDDSVDDDKLRELFSARGKITSAKVMLDEKGASRCFGFVCFSTPKEAHNAVAELNRTIFHGHPLYVAMAQSKEVRRRQLQLQKAEHALKVLSPPYPAAGHPTVCYSPLTSQGIAYPQHFSPSPGWRSSGSPPFGVDFQAISPQMVKYCNANVSPQPNYYQPSVWKMSPFKNSMTRPGPAVPFYDYQRPDVCTPLLPSEAHEQEKQRHLENLSSCVQKQQYEDPGKLLDMILDMDNSRLRRLLGSPELLTTWTDKAAQLIQLSNRKPAARGTSSPLKAKDVSN